MNYEELPKNATALEVGLFTAENMEENAILSATGAQALKALAAAYREATGEFVISHKAALAMDAWEALPDQMDLGATEEALRIAGQFYEEFRALNHGPAKGRALRGQGDGALTVSDAMVEAALPHLYGSKSPVRPIGQFWPGESADESELHNQDVYARDRVRCALRAALFAPEPATEGREA